MGRQGVRGRVRGLHPLEGRSVLDPAGPAARPLQMLPPVPLPLIHRAAAAWQQAGYMGAASQQMQMQAALAEYAVLPDRSMLQQSCHVYTRLCATPEMR